MKIVPKCLKCYTAYTVDIMSRKPDVVESRYCGVVVGRERQAAGIVPQHLRLIGTCLWYELYHNVKFSRADGRGPNVRMHGINFTANYGLSSGVLGYTQ